MNATDLAAVAPSSLVITSIAHWKKHVAAMTTAEQLNAGMAFLKKGEKSLCGLHPFKQQEKMGLAYYILHEHAKTLPVTRYSTYYRDTPPLNTK